MINIDDSLWWHPDYGFFSMDFYLKGDNSKEGFSPNNPLSNSQRTKKEVEFIIKLLQPKKGDTFLDCPCGYGRHLIELASQGFIVTGIDINKPFLDLGIKDAGIHNLNGNTKFLQQNMIEMNFPHSSFDYAINMFTSLGFFEKDFENEKVIKNFSNVLKPNGKLLLYFDYNSSRIINHKYFNGDENKNRKCLFNGKKYDLYVEEHYDKTKKRLFGTWTLRNGGDPVTKKYSIRIYSNEEIKKLLLYNGFSEVMFFDPNNNNFSDKSQETIIVATK